MESKVKERIQEGRKVVGTLKTVTLKTVNINRNVKMEVKKPWHDCVNNNLDKRK